MISHLANVQPSRIDLRKDGQFDLEGLVVEIHAWKENKPIAHWTYSAQPIQLIRSKNIPRVKDGLDALIVIVKRSNTPEIIGLSIDDCSHAGVSTAESRFERQLPTVTPSGSYIGTITLSFVTGDRTTQSVSAQRNRAMSQQRVTTSMSIDPSSCSVVKQLSTEKSRLESRLSILQLEIYEKDAVIGNLNIQLKIKQEQSKYLYTSERIKQVTAGLQAENRELKQRISELQSQLKQHKDKQYEMSTSSGVQKEFIENWSYRLGRLSSSLNQVLSGLDHPYGVSTRYQEMDSDDRALHRQILSVEKLTAALLKKHHQEKEMQSCLHSTIEQLHENLFRAQHELSEQKQLYLTTKHQTEQLIVEVRKYTEIVERKEQQAEGEREQSKQLEKGLKAAEQHLCDARLQNERLRIEMKNSSARISDLEKSNFELAQANKRFREMCGIQDRTYRAGLQSHSRRIMNEEHALLQKFQQFKEREERLKQERDAYKYELDALTQQLERLYHNCDRIESVNRSTMLSEANQQKPAHRNLDQLYSLEIKKRKLIEEQLTGLRARYEKQTGRLRQRIKELQEWERSTVELSNQLGFPLFS